MNNNKDKRYIPEKEFIKIYERVPRFCVEVLVKTEDGILITKRAMHPFKSYWHFAGGTVYLKESIKKAVKRVAKSELNLDVDFIRSVGEMEFLGDRKKKGQNHMVSIACIVEAKDIGSIRLDEQASNFMFCKYKSDIPKHIIKEHAVLLNKILKDNPNALPIM